MKMTYSKVRDAVMALGKNDRQKLRAELDDLEVPPEAEHDPPDNADDMRPDMTEEEVHDELKRRMDEAERDPSVMISWEVAEKHWRELAK